MSKVWLVTGSVSGLGRNIAKKNSWTGFHSHASKLNLKDESVARVSTIPPGPRL
jgi:hypothetical protein